MARDRGTAGRARVGRPTSARSTFPDGLSAGSRYSSSCRTVSLTVAPFPPGALLPFIGTMRRSDFCRPFVGVSALFTSNYHSGCSGGGRQISPGKVHETLMQNRRLYAFSPTDIGRRCWEPAHPGEYASDGASLSFDSASHLRLPSDAPSRALAPPSPALRPCHFDEGFPPSGSPEDWSSHTYIAAVCFRSH